MFDIDEQMVTRFIFHPRSEGKSDAPPGAVPTETAAGDAVVCGYLFPNRESGTLLLFFHGNGEIAADYGMLAKRYTDCGASFWAVDYRGYGRSTGTPSFTRMVADAKAVLEDTASAASACGILFENIVVMGRSLGSAPAIYLAATCPDRIAGLILDSPFSDGPALIERLGGPGVDLKKTPEWMDNRDRIMECRLPTLIIHGSEDWIIPVSEAEELHRKSPSPQKRIVKISGAGHNDLLFKGYDTYFTEITSLLESIRIENRR